ncbi:hypothetical protein BC826DRAFT_999062 [Russula brevipes]|nr:hypothetical protein BC826DRAFT_999062 [Russula brevipes]
MSSNTEGFGSRRTVVGRINDDILIEIFDFCRIDSVHPHEYPSYWWFKFAHVCQKWRRAVLASPNRLKLTLIYPSRAALEDLLAYSPPLPLVIYWRKSISDQDQDDNIFFALQHPDRLCRITLYPPFDLHGVCKALNGRFPVLETLELYGIAGVRTTWPSAFEAPNLRHLYLSDLTLLPPQLSRFPVISPASLVTFALGETTPNKRSPLFLMECLSFMPALKHLKIGFLFPGERYRTPSGTRETSRSPLPTALEEIQFQGASAYIEGLAALISAPRLKKLSITFSDTLSTVDLPHLSQLINGAADLAFPFARVRFLDGVSIVMDHNILWTGRGAFELRIRSDQSDFGQAVWHVAEVCSALAPMPSTVQSLLLEDAQKQPRRNRSNPKWHELLRLFDNLKTLRVAHFVVHELDQTLQSEGEGSTLLPSLQEIVCYGPVREFAAFVKARQSLRVVNGPKDRLTLV